MIRKVMESVSMPVAQDRTAASPGDHAGPVGAIVRRFRFGWKSALLTSVAAIILVWVASQTLSLRALLDISTVLILAIFATATNLLLGYGGQISFGQACFYGSGAYLVALSWQHSLMPFWATLVLAPVLGGVLALIIGGLTLRTTGMFFGLLTLGFSQLFAAIAGDWSSVTGGDDGIVGPMIPDALVGHDGFLLIGMLTVACLLLLWGVTRSQFGLVLRSIRENPGRAQALGVNVRLHRLAAFTISGMFCAIAGALMAVNSQAAFPTMLDWNQSGAPVLSSILGGMSFFLGPFLGAIVYQYGSELLTQYTSHWELVLGAIFLVVVLFAPQGIAGVPGQILALRRRLTRRSDRAADRGSAGPVESTRGAR